MSLQILWLLVQCFLVCFTKKSLWEKKCLEPRIEKDESRYKIQTPEEPKKNKNRVGSKTGFFCLTVVLETKEFWK